MRKQATELEVGKWYADLEDVCSFLRFSHEENGIAYYDKVIYIQCRPYSQDVGEYYSFPAPWNRHLPTQEEILKYNLV